MPFLGALALAASACALPVYDDFSAYGASGALLGGNTAPSGESWIAYTNETLANLVAGANVCVTNYFTTYADTMSASLPSGFPGPFVSGNDNSAYSIWTPGYLGANSPLGGVGACLQFASPVSNIAGNKIFVSFFVDVPAVVGGGDSYGQGQSEGFGWTAGFLPASLLPSPTGANQNTVPSTFEKFNARASAVSNPTGWKPGVGFNTATSGAGLASVSTVNPATIHFIVLDYEFNGGTGTDEERIWVDPAAANFGVNTQPASNASASPTAAASLAAAGGFFFLAYCQNDAALPPFGIIYNSLRIGTNWAYVTGGPQFASYAPATTNIVSGNTLVLNSTAVAGGLPVTYAWANSSGPFDTLGSHFSVGPTGALAINNVQAGDADTYTLQVSTPITTENGVSPATATTVVTVIPSPPFFTLENASGIGSGQFQMNFFGPVGFSYRIWASTNLALSPVTNTWTLVSASTFTSGVNTFADTSATNSAAFYVITVP